MKRLLSAVSALALLPLAGEASAQAPAAGAQRLDDASLFGARQGVRQISLSPGGTKVAFIAPGKGQGNALYVVDAAGGKAPTPALVASGDPDHIETCGWVSEDRLACDIHILVKGAIEIMPASRVVAVDANGENSKLLSNHERSDTVDNPVLGGGAVIDWLGGDGAVLIGRLYVPLERLGSNLKDNRSGYGVDRLDTRSLATKEIEPPKPAAVDYLSDGRGNIRIMETATSPGATGQVTGIYDYFYRKKGSREWLSLSTWDDVRREGFQAQTVDVDKDVVYGVRKKDGRLAAYAITLDGGKAETLVYAHPQVDVDGFVGIGRSRRPVGVTFATDKRRVVYFDPQLQSLARNLSRALPNLPLVYFLDSSSDETKLLLWAGSDIDPGRYYVFDKATKHLSELMLTRPELENAKLASVRHIIYRAADGTEVPAYLTLPPGSEGKKLAALVMPHGGPESRDEWGFDWLAQYFARQGYAVLQPEYRGSQGYGDAWFKKNGFKSWRAAIGDINDAGRWLVAQGIADPGKLGIFGWSYGGYAALQANVVDPKLFKAVVAVAPVADLPSLTEEWRNWTNHRIEVERIGTGSEPREGSPAQHADAFIAPVLLFHGDRDRTFNVHQSQLMASRLKGAGKSVDLVVYPKLDHPLDDSEARADMLRKADAFLKANLHNQ
ncbi:MAG TPA: alpha/beta fold hydrolase [Allosphingosinicella sp.]|jgi:dipeptidyl aminopeptidase/acylaminoacyl peptidase